jgi:hypothetical protein
MTDSAISIGDVCFDLAQCSKVQVVGHAADCVAEYSEREGYDLAEYKCHPQLRVSEDEPVYTCVYLPDSLKSSVSGTYDFPESRLARCPVEEANEDLNHIGREFLDEFLTALAEASVTEGQEKAAADVVRRAFGAGAAGLFVELQDTEKLGGGEGE